MEHYKRSKLLNNSTASKFLTKKWIDLNDLSSGKYSINKNGWKVENLNVKIGYTDAYLIINGTITVERWLWCKRNKKVAFKNNALLRSCISKINNTFTGKGEHLDIVMPRQNLLEYSDNYSMTIGSFWNYYRYKVNDDANENVINRINNNKKITSNPFEQKTKLIRSTTDDKRFIRCRSCSSVKISEYSRISFDLLLINIETKLDLPSLK